MNTGKPLYIHIIGAGGIASYLLPVLAKIADYTPRVQAIIVHDGDTLEERNLDRQLFDPTRIGENKAIALVQKNKYIKTPLLASAEYVYNTHDLLEKTAAFMPKLSAEEAESEFLPEFDVLYFVCADNNEARQIVIDSLDLIPETGHNRVPDYQTRTAIIGANETHSAEAYIVTDTIADYEPWHPYQIYPELKDDDGQSPLQAAGCTGHSALLDKPQLPLANFKAAEAMLQLFNAWFYPNKEPSIYEFELHGILDNMPWLITKNEYHTKEYTYGYYSNLPVIDNDESEYDDAELADGL